MQIFTKITLALFLITLSSPIFVSAFSFSESEEQEARESRASTSSIADLNCPTSFRSKKIGTMIGEQHRDERYRHRFYGYFTQSDDPNWDNRFGSNRSVYGSLVDDLNMGFQQLGLKTFTADQINEQIASEEQQAFLNNDMEAAITAAERLQADFILKGVISTLTQKNTVVKVDELFVTIKLSLLDNSGHRLATATVKETVFSDADIPATIQQIIADQSETIIYQLFNRHCNGGN